MSDIDTGAPAIVAAAYDVRVVLRVFGHVLNDAACRRLLSAAELFDALATERERAAQAPSTEPAPGGVTDELLRAARLLCDATEAASPERVSIAQRMQCKALRAALEGSGGDMPEWKKRGLSFLGKPGPAGGYGP